MESEHAVDTNSATGSQSTEHSPMQPCRDMYMCHFILPSRNGDHVLAEVDGNCVARLPKMELPAGIDQANREDAMERGIETVFGLSVYIVRLLSDEERMEGFECVGMDYLYLGDVLDAKPEVLKPFEWIPRDVACASEWAATTEEGVDEHIRTEVRNVFREKNGETSLAHFCLWENMGWFAEVTMWCQKLLEGRNLVLAGRMRQRSRTAQSAVMTCEVKMRGKRKLEGNGGGCESIFIKNTIPSLREVERTVAVAGVIGNIVPEIIGFEERKGLLMMRNGGSISDEVFDQEALIDTVLKMQKLSMNRINELEAGGLKVRDSEWVESNVESILNHELLDKYYVRYGNINEGDKATVDKIRAKVGLTQKRCGEVTKLGLPKTLVHGDMFESNVGSPMRIEGKAYRIFDWAKSFIGNPLHDFETLLHWQWRSVDGESGEVSTDLAAGMGQICEVWKACSELKWEEMKSVFGTVNRMSTIIGIQDLVEEYEELDDKNCDRAFVIMGGLGEQLDLFREW